MLVVGAKGFAKEVLNILLLKNEMKDLVFFDDVNQDGPDFLFDQFPILKSIEEAKNYFKTIDNRFTLGVGFPQVRYKLYHKFIELGVNPYTLISPNSDLGDFEVKISDGVSIAYHCAISNSVSIGKGSFINAKTIIGHDSRIGEFCEICPSVNIAGHIDIGDYTFIGTGAIIYPNVKIGSNVAITAGSVVRKNVPDNSIVHGFPAKIIGKKPGFKT
ncbi:acetyltransferase [Weeksellaceae bacterium KMM 9724]|uniref:acetyltransferase n=1 Tax=Profundicola chukchiensis TaxID=2961959 RepID=UPI00243BF30B|nr:acetyltransferase [Profundicola chukchiensis]MDG4949873.1 acetyltransferase [Profundicola chukchiensis]